MHSTTVRISKIKIKQQTKPTDVTPPEYCNVHMVIMGALPIMPSLKVRPLKHKTKKHTVKDKSSLKYFMQVNLTLRAAAGDNTVIPNSM